MLQLNMARALALCAFCFLLALNAPAQSTATTARPMVSNSAAAVNGKSSADGSDLDDVRRQLREQQQELERMRAIIAQQSNLIDDLRQRVEHTEQSTNTSGVIKTGEIAASDTTTRATAGTGPQASSNKGQADNTVDARLARAEEQIKKNSETITKQLGSITFSGDLRLRYEALLGQLNTSPNADNPAILGNELTARNRLRVRARLALRGQIGKEFDWGLRFVTGSLAEAISGNQTLTDFYNKKPFGLDQFYLAWTPQRVPGLRLQGGKFDVPWLRTELTIDNDVQPEGLSESYSRNFKRHTLKNITAVAWQLPFLERNSTFVRNANGTVNLSESRRGGRDLALYGAQLRTRLEPSPTVALTLSAADLFFSGTQFITPIQFLGRDLQLPVTINIPATATTPAQTITTQVTIPRDLLVAGNANLGLSTATNNATNRDGRLSSGFNLVDLIGRLDLSGNKRWPIALILNFVHNTQAHDVVAAGPGGTNQLFPNHESNGYWAELQAGKNKERGDVLFNYVFMRIEKDAVLTPFNFDELVRQSDVRAHRLSFSYTADPRVTLAVTGLFSQRPNGLLGVFSTTPPGSLNRPTTRLQFDTIFRF